MYVLKNKMLKNEMGTVELRNIISQKLLGIEDVNILQKIISVIDSQYQEQTYILSDEQKFRIEEARKEYSKGNSISEKDVEMEINQWLNAK